MEVQLGRNQDVDEWMKLVEEISWNFPGLETMEGLNEYRETLLRFIAKEITVSTFREEDEKGVAPRALYKKFGFIEDELIEEFGYPNQKFVLHPNQK